MSKKVVRYLIYILLVCVFAIFVFKLNQTEKTELVVRTGQTFEKAEVTEILQDNLDSNGTRVGEQKVRVKMLTGARKGEELDITSSSGYLFGAACKVGMKVIVMQSVAGETTIASVYSQDREWVIYIFALLYLLALCVIGGKQGIKGCLGLFDHAAHQPRKGAAAQHQSVDLRGVLSGRISGYPDIQPCIQARGRTPAGRVQKALWYIGRASTMKGGGRNAGEEKAIHS